MRSQDLLAIAPEILLTAAAIAVLLVGAVARRVPAGAFVVMSLAGVAASGVATAAVWDRFDGVSALGQMVATDALAGLARAAILVVTALGVLLGAGYFRHDSRGEFYALLLFAATGMMLLASSADLIMVFLGLEILSLSLYVLCGFTLQLGSGEAALKYFLLGALSSAIFLYGIAMTYGATGTTRLTGVVAALDGVPDPGGLALVAVGLLGAGFAFKVSAVPFHMWTPDVYQGAPTAVTSFMAAATKIAAFVALIRVLDVAFQPLTWNWTPVVEVVAAITVVAGAILSIVQTDVKRLLAYSSVANAGFILVGVSAGALGIRSVLFYLIAYGATVLGAFGVVMVVSERNRERSSIDGFTGLARRNPVLAGLTTVFLLSLAGVPPTAGFLAKVAVFGAAATAGHWVLVLVAVLAAVAAAYAYVRIIVRMYMRDPESVPQAELHVGAETAVAIWVPAVVVVLLGVLPGLIAGVIEQAAVLRW